MFYDVYCELCRKNGLTPSGAAAKIGFNRASVTVWKNSGNPPKTELLHKIADYFNVSVDFLLGKAQKETPTDSVSINDDDIKFALSGGEGVIADEQYEEVKKFVQFIKERDGNDKK